jgi:hypothetical protein
LRLAKLYIIIGFFICCVAVFTEVANGFHWFLFFHIFVLGLLMMSSGLIMAHNIPDEKQGESKEREQAKVKRYLK